MNSWWHPPALPLRSSVARALLAGALATAGLVIAVQSAVDASAGYATLSVLVFVTAAFVIAGRIGAHHPFDRFGPGNVVTLGRVVLLATVTGMVAEPPATAFAWLAIALMAGVVLLDGVDGWLARRSGLFSAFGARFDMETDALAILVLSTLVWRHDKAGVWVLGCGLMRYAFAAAGWLLPWLAAPLRSTFRGKSVAVLQFVGLSAALCPSVPRRASAVIAAISLAALAWSFALDVAWLWRRRVTSPM